MTHTIAGARGQVKDRDAVLRRAQGWAEARGSDVLLADASVVFGRDHLESAVLHAERSRDAGLMATRSVSMEALLYLAAQKQVTDAIRVAGIKEGSRATAIAIFGRASIEELVAHLGWLRDDGVLDSRRKDLGILGIRNAERSTVPERELVDLALERTALLDVLK